LKGDQEMTWASSHANGLDEETQAEDLAVNGATFYNDVGGH
jgi:hypothetical protein